MTFIQHVKYAAPMKPGNPLPQEKALAPARRRRIAKPPDLRRRDILDASVRLFRERGYEACTVQQIAAAAGVAAGTVYLHFASKDAILVALQDDFEQGLLERFAEVAEAVLAEEERTGTIVNHVETVDRLIDGVVGYCLDHRDASRVIARHLGRAMTSEGPAGSPGGLADVVARVIVEGVRLGHVHASDPPATAYLLNLAAVTALAQAVAADDDDWLRRVVASTKEMFVKTLAPIDELSATARPEPLHTRPAPLGGNVPQNNQDLASSARTVGDEQSGD
jgi:AcrR family transcriptional regulator